MYQWGKAHRGQSGQILSYCLSVQTLLLYVFCFVMLPMKETLKTALFLFQLALC